MCTVSNIGDEWGRTFPQRWPDWVPPSQPAQPFEPLDLAKRIQMPPLVTRAEFDALKKELEELKKLLMAAKKYDTATGQADCESESKIALFRQLAKLLGVDVSEAFKPAVLQPLDGVLPTGQGE